MTKQEIERSLNEFNGGSPFINISRLAKYLRVRSEHAAAIVENLDRLESGREKRYFTGDVARELLRRRVM